jgi:hypothetical protein
MTIGKKVRCTVFLHEDLHRGIEALIAENGESAGVVIRSLVREGLQRHGIGDFRMRQIEDAYGIGGVPGNASVRPLSRGDK